MQIAGHTFLVTGGASGLGAATARRLAAAGGNVVICDIEAEPGKRLALELGACAAFHQTDVTDEAQVANAIASAGRQFGALHGAVSCAGVAPGERVLGKGGPHRPGKWMSLAMCHQLPTSGQDTGLRPAQQFITAKCNHITTCLQTI